jgi:hypothetical protein
LPPMGDLRRIGRLFAVASVNLVQNTRAHTMPSTTSWSVGKAYVERGSCFIHLYCSLFVVPLDSTSLAKFAVPYVFSAGSLVD